MSVVRPAAGGFVAGGIACGIKESGAPDLAIVATEDRVPAVAAGVFTTNLAASRAGAGQHAASRRRPRRRGRPRTPATPTRRPGERGRRDARRMCALTARRPRRRGHRRARVLDRVSSASRCRWRRSKPGSRSSCARCRPPAALDAARAIMTTDTVPKEAVATVGAVTVGGMAKGAAMLSPAMATMLAVVTTDAAVDHATLAARARPRPCRRRSTA